MVGSEAVPGSRAIQTGETAMTDKDVRQDVQSALEREPALDASAIAVAVEDLVVTLRGDVSTYFEKHDAERVALGVYGVNAVANDLIVRMLDGQPSDTELARAVVDGLTSNALVPLHRVGVIVADGWVTLSGTLDWEYQRTSAERSARKVAGVKGVSNTIILEQVDALRPLAPSA
jgi:osmotically-inducible protein OsmY